MTSFERPAGNSPVGGRTSTRKSLGQHFLADSRIAGRILAAVDLSPHDLIVEVGPGRGVLTKRLVDRVKRVVAIELDGELAAALPARLDHPANLTCVEADARVADLAEVIAPDTSYKVVANLPYYAANPIIRRLLESDPKPESLVVMVQQEVAKNMVAQPGNMGILSVATQFYAKAKVVCSVPPKSFRPPPKVTSAVVRLDTLPAPAADVASEEDFFTVVRAGFSAPRKQLRNSLSQGLRIENSEGGLILKEAGIDATRRPQTLDISEWASVYQVWAKSPLAVAKEG
ncbi:MAG: 16S rRNA (adenine(1518)-N(6)/adenine(1519)-N(6))-dimethyltransferase RsmA [Dehalococcoidia bacterium]|nr:16S rRNA (adenine(1518)-N(6)/adenine(1519)-N(6))-dimethyltransferase RsmA [Dehalococcoidia bacterium]